MSSLASRFLLLGLILISVQLSASPDSMPKYGTLEGEVIDAQTGWDGPLGDRGVVVERLARVRADSTGRFVIANLPPGAYAIRTSHVGYRARTIDNVAGEGGRKSPESKWKSIWRPLM